MSAKLANAIELELRHRIDFSRPVTPAMIRDALHDMVRPHPEIFEISIELAEDWTLTISGPEDAIRALVAK